VVVLKGGPGERGEDMRQGTEAGGVQKGRGSLWELGKRRAQTTSEKKDKEHHTAP